MNREQILEHISEEKNKWLIFPSVFHLNGNSAKADFEVLINIEELKDAGVRSLHFRETRTGGFEFPSRSFMRAHLNAGDAFIDVGAHFGIYSLSAARLHQDKVKVLAVEPHPQNMARLRMLAEFNNCREQIITSECAASNTNGFSLLKHDSSMGYRLFFEDEDSNAAKHNIKVPLKELDKIASETGITEYLDEHGKIILKIDTEGHELQVILGAMELFKSGKIKAVIWEKGFFHQTQTGVQEFKRIMDLLRDFGFDSYRFPHEDMGGPLVPYVPSPDCCNIISVDRELELMPVYKKPWSAHPILSRRMTPTLKGKAAAEFTEALMDYKSTDCGRWCRWENLYDQADLRCGVAAHFVPEQSSVIDCGSGFSMLRDYIPASCSYTPLDLVARTRDTIVADLNQNQYPDKHYDVTVALFLLEFLHEPESFLQWAARHSSQLITSYTPMDNLSSTKRRESGFFNDLTLQGVNELLNKCGWILKQAESISNKMILFNCQKKEIA